MEKSDRLREFFQMQTAIIERLRVRKKENSPKLQF